MNEDLVARTLQEHLSEADYLDCMVQCCNVPGPWVRHYPPSEKVRSRTSEIVVYCDADDFVLVGLAPLNPAPQDQEVQA